MRSSICWSARRTTASPSRCGTRSCSTRVTCRRSASIRSSRKASADEASIRLSRRCLHAELTRRMRATCSTRIQTWPDRSTVQAFAAEADRQVIAALESADIDRPGHPLLDRAEAVFTILEHEAMHQETLLYMWHRLPLMQKRWPCGYLPITSGREPEREWLSVAPGRVELGADRATIPFGWDNETPGCAADVAAFEIERYDVTNGRYLEFVDAGGYRDERWWTAGDWQWLRAEGIESPAFWERTRRDVVVAGDVRAASPSARMAGVRQPRGGLCLRAVARSASPDRSGISAGRLRLTFRRAQILPVGR